MYSSSKFIALYLLFSIGIKGGHELAHSELNLEILMSLLFGMILSFGVPTYTFFILRRRLSVSDSGAIAAAFGSVSAVTFVTAISFLESQKVIFGGHMVGVMAFMEFPAIMISVILMKIFDKSECYNSEKVSLKQSILHSISNGSVVLILGSLVIGFIANDKQIEGIKPFTTDLFKGFLAIFLLDMGITASKRFKSFIKQGWFLIGFSIIIPLFNGCLVAIISGLITESIGDRFLLSILAASASYIAVPAAMKLAAPKADPGLYIPMALGVTFPFNITIGMPIFYFLVGLF